MIPVVASAAEPLQPVERDAIQTAPSVIERLWELQTDDPSRRRPAIRLVQIDNGRASDASEYLPPSQLMLGIHLDGEACDVNINYVVLQGLESVSSARWDAAAQQIRVQVVLLNSDSQPVRTFINLSLAEVLAEVSHPDGAESHSGGTQCTVRSTVGVTYGRR